jgi:hypothetical protein
MSFLFWWYSYFCSCKLFDFLFSYILLFIPSSAKCYFLSSFFSSHLLNTIHTNHSCQRYTSPVKQMCSELRFYFCTLRVRVSNFIYWMHYSYYSFLWLFVKLQAFLLVLYNITNFRSSNLSFITSHYLIRHNLLKTNHNPLYIRNQSVPRCKHFPPQL